MMPSATSAIPMVQINLRGKSAVGIRHMDCNYVSPRRVLVGCHRSLHESAPSSWMAAKSGMGDAVAAENAPDLVPKIRRNTHNSQRKLKIVEAVLLTNNLFRKASWSQLIRSD